MANMNRHNWLLAAFVLVFILLVAFTARGQSPTSSQTYFRRAVMERRPDSLVMSTSSNTILTAESQWKGHAITLQQAFSQVRRGPVFLIEPVTNQSTQIPPVPMITDNVRSTVRIGGTNRYGLFVVGRRVVIP